MKVPGSQVTVHIAQRAVRSSWFTVQRISLSIMRAVGMLLLMGFFVVLNSCGDTNNAEKKDSVADSAGMTDENATREIQTDSGKLIITHLQGTEIDDVVMMDAAGNIAARGYMFNNRLTGAWLKYDVNGNVITAMHYSEGVPKYALDANDFKTERVEYKEMGISFAVPVNWDTIAPFNPKSFVSYEKEVIEAGLIMKPNINIAKGSLETGQTLESLAAQQLDLLHQTVGRVELVDEAFFTIDSCKAFRRYGMYYTEDNKVGFLDAIIIKGNDVYVISCAAQNREQGEFLKYQAVFENVVLSMQFP